MNKQEVIKKAYGEYWEALPGWSKEFALNNNGRTQLGANEYDSKLWALMRKSKLFDMQPIFPKSLQGIENNNGWIKIESEADLPKESGDYWTYEKNGSIGIRFFMSIPKTWGNHEMEVEEPNVTHYQAITKPLKPIY